MQKILLSILVILLFACKEEKDVRYSYYENGKVNEETEYKTGLPNGKQTIYYNSGKLKSVAYFKNGKLNGIIKAYYESGKLKYIREYKEGIANGEYQFFYQNGNLCQKGTLQNGLRKGYFYDYFEKEDGRLWKKAYFFNFQGQEAILYSHEYSRDGQIVKTTSKVEVSSDRDTIELGERIELKIKLLNPQYDSMMVILGKYNDKFYLPDSVSLDTIQGVAHQATIDYIPTKAGNQYIRGMVVGYELLEEKGDTTKTSSEFVYFEWPCYVK